MDSIGPELDRQVLVYLEEALGAIQTHRLRGTPKLHAAFAELFDEHAMLTTPQNPQMLRQANARAALHRLIIEVVRSSQPAGPPDAFPFEVARTIEVLHETRQDPNVMDRVRECVGVDLKTLNRQFEAHLGTTLAQYWLRERIRLARTMLEVSDASVTHIACEFGFSSGQHFATAFRKITGLTPSQYRSAWLGRYSGLDGSERLRDDGLVM
jgi:AraC-like DNA-binding protein